MIGINDDFDGDSMGKLRLSTVVRNKFREMLTASDCENPVFVMVANFAPLPEDSGVHEAFIKGQGNEIEEAIRCFVKNNPPLDIPRLDFYIEDVSRLGNAEVSEVDGFVINLDVKSFVEPVTVDYLNDLYVIINDYGDDVFSKWFYSVRSKFFSQL